MSDLRLYNTKSKKVISKVRLTKAELKGFLETNFEELFGITILFKDYKLINRPETIELLGYDENNQIVIIEYRTGKFTNTINKGLVSIDYLKDNLSILKTDINEKYNYELSSSLVYEPRLLVIGDDFNKFDEYAIGQMPYIVDFIKYQAYDNKFLLLEKSFQSRQSYQLEQTNLKTKTNLELYERLREFVLSLGDEVGEIGFDNFVAYRKIKNFMYVFVKKGLELKLKNEKFKTIKINTMDELEKAFKEIEICYDKN